MGKIDICWLYDESSLKDALKSLLHCSGQLLKRHYSSQLLGRPQRAKEQISLPVDLVNHLKINPSYQGPLALILKETADYIVLHKPSGVHCHPLCYTDDNTVLNFLAVERKWDLLKVNESSYDRGLVYRLDFETSGVLVLAKTNEFYRKLRENFEKLVKRKFYWAIVDGDFEREGKWTHYFIPSGVKGSKQKVSDFSKGESIAGTLTVHKLMYQNEKSLLLVKLESGHRHQIRAQLSHLGYPILGDELYGGGKSQRLFLHALHYDWGEIAEDAYAELFESFFDLNSALQMSHDILRTFQSN